MTKFLVGYQAINSWAQPQDVNIDLIDILALPQNLKTLPVSKSLKPIKFSKILKWGFIIFYFYYAYR